jgi:hypothetical protein
MNNDGVFAIDASLRIGVSAFQRLDEALRFGVVVRVARLAHADVDLALPETAQDGLSGAGSRLVSAMSNASIDLGQWV